MAAATRLKSYTFDDFCLLIKEGQKADLIAGVIYMASPDNTDANDLFVWFLSLIYDFVELNELGKVFGSRVAFRLDDWNSPEPDIGFVSKDRLHLVRRGHVAGPPDLAVEIVSPESEDRDYGRKKDQYQEAGVAEYWIIDEMKKKVTIFRLTNKGKYREVRLQKGELHSLALPGFWIRPEWFWEPRPRKVDIFQVIISRK